MHGEGPPGVDLGQRLIAEVLTCAATDVLEEARTEILLVISHGRAPLNTLAQTKLHQRIAGAGPSGDIIDIDNLF